MRSLRTCDSLTIGVLFAVVFIHASDFLSIAPILPDLARDFGVTLREASWWVSAYSISAAIVGVISGAVSDRIGRRSVLLVGMPVVVVGTLLCAAAQTPLAMLCARALTGAGGGMLLPASAFAADHFDDQRRPVAIGWVFSGFFFAVVIGMPLGALMTHTWGRQVMFVIFAAGACAVWLAMLVALPAPRFERRTDSIRKAALAYGSLLANRRVLAALLMSAAIGFAVMPATYASPWLEVTFGLEAHHRGIAFAIAGPAIVFAGPIAGRYAVRFGRINVLVAATLLIVCAQIALPFTSWLGDRISAQLGASGTVMATFGRVMWPVVIPTLLVMSIVSVFKSGQFAPFVTLTNEVCFPEQRGALTALREGVREAGTSLGAMVGGLMWVRLAQPYYWISIVASAANLTAVGMLYIVMTRRPSR